MGLVVYRSNEYSRVDIIGQNGNDGEHYKELDNTEDSLQKEDDQKPDTPPRGLQDSGIV